MNIHQMSVRYLAEQDRILMRINTSAQEEFRLWFTRRFTLGFLPLLRKAVAEHVARQNVGAVAAVDDDSKQMLAEFKRAEALQQADMTTPYRAQPAKLPFGAEPLLVTDVEIAPQTNGKLQLGFQEKRQGEGKPRGFHISIGPQLTHGLVHLVERELQKSRWLEATGPVPSGQGEPANDATAPNRPRYLN